MKTLHSGTSEFPATVKYAWKLEAAEDHEHPYVLTVTVSEHTHSEGCGSEISETEASAKADKLARELHATIQARS